MKKAIFIFLCLTLLSRHGFSQCPHPVEVNDSSINTISSVFQLTFLHEVPKNRIDSAVLALNDPNIKHIILESAVVRSIGETHSREGFLFLYTCCKGPTVYEDLTLFGRLCSIVQLNGGLQTLNTFYLNNAVPETLPPDSFRNEVLTRCKKKKPQAFFCPQPNREITVEELQLQIDTTFSEEVPCSIPMRITPENIYAVHNPYELTFLHKTPVNATDTLVFMLLNYHFPTAAEAVSLLEKVFSKPDAEAYKFLYMCCAVSPKSDIQNNLFHSISNHVGIWGGFRCMNRYYLNNAVSEQLPEWTFREEVLKHCLPRMPEMYYCHQYTIQELYANAMKDIDPGKYDREIVRIIHRNSRPEASVNRGQRIAEEVLQLPFVTDVLWDGCYEKLAIYPAYYVLMVKMSIDDKIVERYYSIHGSTFRYIGIRKGNRLIFGRTFEIPKDKFAFKSCGYSPGYMKAAREYCEKKRREEEEEME